MATPTDPPPAPALTFIREHWQRESVSPKLLITYALIFLGGTAVICAALYAHGTSFLDDANEHFGERSLGTYFSTGLLITAAVVCGQIRGSIKHTAFANFWLVAMIGYSLLAADELLRIHERLDEWFHLAFSLDPEDPLTDHLDDAIVALYPLIALGFAWKFRVQLLALKWLVLFMALATVFFAVMVVLDVVSHKQWAEESAKLCTAGTMVLALAAARHSTQLRPIAERTGSQESLNP